MKIFLRAQCINKLYIFNWFYNWRESYFRGISLAKKKSIIIKFNLDALSKGRAIGFSRVGSASKKSKARLKINSVSVGMPMNMIKGFTKKDVNGFICHNTTKL